MWSLPCEQSRCLWRICGSFYSQAEQKNCPHWRQFFQKRLWEVWTRKMDPKSWRSDKIKWKVSTPTAELVIGSFLIYSTTLLFTGCLSVLKFVDFVVWKSHTHDLNHLILRFHHSWTKTMSCLWNSNPVQRDSFSTKCHANFTKIHVKEGNLFSHKDDRISNFYPCRFHRGNRKVKYFLHLKQLISKEKIYFFVRKLRIFSPILSSGDGDAHCLKKNFSIF